MASKCKLGADMLNKARKSHEWNDGEKDRIYCYGFIDSMTDELLPECNECRYNVQFAEEDRAEFYKTQQKGGAE